MPAIPTDFNAGEVNPNTGYDPLPPGRYKVVISESEEKQTKKGDGSYFQFTFVVIEGEHEKRKLWARLNLNNPNDQAVGIARAELSAICRAVGVLQPKDTTQLHDLPLYVTVVAKPDRQTGEVRNEIRKYEPASAAAGTAPAAGAAAARPAATKPAGTAPWKKQG